MTRVLALTKYGRAAASTRQRLLQYVPALAEAGFQIDVKPLLDDDYVAALASGVAYPKSRLLGAYPRRFADLRRAQEYDVLWVYAELFPRLPSLFEALAIKAGPPVIYDIDDAFFHEHERSALLRDKLKPLIAGAAAVSAGNAYLADYARRWNPNVHIVPTTVDTDAYVPAALRPDRPPVIGWIGSPSTWAYVRPYLPVLADLCAGGRARFLAVGAGKGAHTDLFNGMELRDWAEHREIADVQAMDIGIMPLPDEPWARGKCGYKLIQYMACGLPVVASPVGVNCEIVNEENGLLATSDDEWSGGLLNLIENVDLRRMMGKRSRTRAVVDYSLATHAPRLIEIFRTVEAAR
jgi:glycosyltransferase involved in cell wall biosynthesis